MAVKKVESFNLHETPAINQNEFDVETYLNANWGKTKEAVNNNAEELMQAQKDISTLKEDNKTNKSSIDVLEKSNETRDGKISKNAEDIEAIQGSIKTAIETINKKDNEQDEDIKANKESIEELKAENLEIKVENERLRNDIKSIAVVGEESGENIHIEDSSNARCEIEIGGNQKQNTREGYNLLNNDDLNLSSKTLQTKRKLKIDANTEYSIVSEKEFTDVAVNAFSDDINYEKLILTKEKQNKQYYYKFTTKSDTQTIYFYVVSADEYTNVNDFVNSTKLMLIKGSKAIDYEQYGASPSFAYPSPVKSVGNIKNILDMSNAKNGASAGIICTTNADGSYKYNGTATSQYINVWFMGGYATDLPTLFTLEPGTYYINDVSLFEGTTGFANDSSKKIWTFIRAYNVTGVRAVGAVSGNTYDETKYPIIAKIDHEIPWVPYDCGYAKVNIQNKNIAPIFNLGTNWKYTDKGIKNTIISSGKDLTKFKLKAGQTIKIGFKLLSKPSQDTTFTCYVDKVGSIIPSFGKIATYNLNQVYERTYTATKDCEISVTLWGNANSDIFEFQMWAEYDNLTEYQKYDEQSYLVDVQQEMLEGDYLDLENEKEHHEWGKVVLDGTETWLEVSYGFVIGVNTVDSIFRNRDKTKFDGYSNYLKVEKTSQAWTKINYCGWNTDGAFWIREDYTIAKNIDDFKAYLKSKYDSGNPVVVYYPLATPVELDFTEAQKAVAKKIKSEAHTYKNITNISAESSEVNPIASVKYLKDAETEHNKLQAQIDEIKQLLSTTETSALLVNNLEKDLRMEV